MEQAKVDQVKEWTRPRNIWKVCKFLGFTGYYQYFIQGYSQIAQPLLDLTKQATVWLSLPKHAVKLPYWSSPWYRRYHHGLAHHMYVSYVSSLVSRLPPLTTPRFGSEVEPDVLYFLSLPRGSIRCP